MTNAPPRTARPDDAPCGDALKSRISACTICAERFAATRTAHRPNPVLWFAPGARILVASQAPGLQVHKANTPFWDRSGARLRDWLGVTEDQFYDRGLFAILPSAFCFPGYSASGSDLPPPPVCAQTWHAEALEAIGTVRLRVIVGSYAQRLHLGTRGSVTQTVRDWRDHAPGTFVLPHPSWRNNAWLKANPWFETDLLPELRAAVRQALAPPG